MFDLKPSQEALAEIDRTIAHLDHETRERIARRTGMDGNAEAISREEWGRFYDQVRPMRREREAIVQAMVDVISIEDMPPVIVRS